MKNKTVIYMHKNKINGKVYIGQTNADPPNRRWKNGNGYDDSPLFYKAIVKYGWDNFEHIILEENLSPEEANQRECYWIQYYKSNNDLYGYNLTIGGKNYMIDKWQDPDYREEMHQSFSKARLKKVEDGTFYEDHLVPMLNGMQRAWSDEEWRSKRIANLMGSKNPNSKAVYNIETGKIFNTIKEAAEWAGLHSVSGIGQCCKGQRNVSGKHPETGVPLHWKYCKDIREEGWNDESF